jgi:hypothetical protein
MLGVESRYISMVFTNLRAFAPFSPFIPLKSFVLKGWKIFVG